MSPLTAASVANLGTTGSSRAEQLASRDTAANAVPPLEAAEMKGDLHLGDGTGTVIKPNLTGHIDKGFFQADNDWTCYRRNYFSCICSFTLSPHPQNSPVYFTPQKSSNQLQVYGYAMTITAVVSDNDAHTIELVQHTPKRDKGPTHNPEKVLMGPKAVGSGHQQALSMYADPAHGRASYADMYCSTVSSTSPPTEHTFERIQFKQATQNNGKRRAAQQYYHLMVELWADVGTQDKDRFVKVACRKSARMIVRGRSPGHYQSDRRGSQSSAPNTGNMAPYGALTDFGQNSLMTVGSGPYATAYDARTNGHATMRHHDIPAEHPMTTEEEKAITGPEPYQYYPGSLYDTHHDLMQPRSSRDSNTSRITSSSEKHVKNEYDLGMTRHFNATPLGSDRLSRCGGPFQGKANSAGYYPTTMMSPSSLSFNVA